MLHETLVELGSADRFIVLASDVAVTPSAHALRPVSPEAIDAAEHQLAAIEPDGASDLGAALRAAAALHPGQVIAETSAGLLLATTTWLYRGPPTAWTSKAGGDDDAALAERWQRLSIASGQLRDDWVTALATRGDVVWAGTYNGGVVRLEGDATTALGGGWINPSGLVWDGDHLLAGHDGRPAGRRRQRRDLEPDRGPARARCHRRRPRWRHALDHDPARLDRPRVSCRLPDRAAVELEVEVEVEVELHLIEQANADDPALGGVARRRGEHVALDPQQPKPEPVAAP